jgi:hypothetical protein
MSLINDALKKAARLRAEEQADLVPPMPGGGRGRVARQREPIRTQTIVLIAGAAVALIVVSAVITGVLMTGKPAPKPIVAERSMPAPAPTTPPLKVAVQAPTIQVPTPRLSPPPAPTPTPTAAPKPPEAAASVAQAPAAVPAAQATQSHNEMIQGIVERFHISGARSAGADSKALIDGHVYKVNEVVDRSVGLRLVRVEPDRLTFADSDGGTYVRSF